MNTIIKIAKHYRISKNTLTNPHRGGDRASKARMEAAFFMRVYEQKSYNFIAKTLGYWDHKPVIYAVKRVSDLIETEDNYNNRLTQIKKMLYL